MKKLIYIIITLFMTGAIASCEKGLMDFNQDNIDIYFAEAGVSKAASANDSIYVSLGYSKSPDSTRNIQVSVTGAPVDYDREYRVVISPLSTAVAGVHFEALPEKFYIKKNMLSDKIPVKLLRTAEMQKESFEVVLDLLPNESFGTNWTIRTAGTKKIKLLSYKIRFNDVVRKPGRWLDAYWGTFSRKKLFYVCEFLEITPEYMDTDMTLGENTVLPKLVQRHLNKERDAGRTVYEEDNITPMRMGNSSQ